VIGQHSHPIGEPTVGQNLAALAAALTQLTKDTLMPYSKALAQVVATVLTALLPLFVDGHLSAVEIINLCIIGASAIGVAIVPNLSAGVAKYAKSILAVIGAVLVLLTSYISDGVLSGDEIVQLVVAAFGALGVYALPAPQHPVATQSYSLGD
jgi:hypothetical protein